MKKNKYQEWLENYKRIEEIVNKHSDLKFAYMINKTHTHFDVKSYNTNLLITDVGETFISKSGLITCEVAYWNSFTELIPYDLLKTQYIRFDNIDRDNKDKGIDYRYDLIKLSWDLFSFKDECKKLENTQIDIFVDCNDEELCSEYRRLREPYLKLRSRYSSKIERYNQIITEIHKQAKK